MTEYIQGYLSSVPAGQRAAIQSVLSLHRASGEIQTSEDMQAELERLLAALLRGEEFKPGFSPSFVDEENPTVISSQVFNDTFQAILTDLYGLFSQVNAADQTIIAHESVRKADWARIRDAVNKVTEDLVLHRYLKLNPEWQDVKYFDFWNGKIGEPTRRAGWINPETKKLSLGLKDAHRVEQIRGPMRTKAETFEISALDLDGSSSDFKPENALDTNDKTFWAHLLLTDGPVVTTWEGTSYQGALVGYTVLFGNAEFVNRIAVLPFSSFPLQVIDIQYRDGDTWATIPDFTLEEASLDWLEYRFERIQANAIRFILFQPNYVRNRYLVPRDSFNLSRLWDQVVNEESLLGIDEEDLTGEQQAQIETNPRFRAYLSGLKRVEDRLGETGIVRGVLDSHENMGRIVEAVTKVVADTDSRNGLILQNVVKGETDADKEVNEDMLLVDKVEYLFGLRSVKIQDLNYQPIGIHRSPKFVMRANPYEIALDVDETNVDLDAPEGGGATYRQSSAEYELELAPDRKHNILPAGTTQVPDELVIIRKKGQFGYLRFTPNGAVQLRASGNLLVNGTDYSVSGRKVTILQNFRPTYRYTATYAPAANQDLLDVDGTYDSVPLDKPDVFDHTDSHGMIDLSYYPFIAYDIVNDEANWDKVDGEGLWVYRMGAGNVTIDGISYGPTSGTREYEPLTIHVNGVKAVNITDYIGRVHPGFQDDPNRSSILQYIHAGKRIYLSRPVQDGTIEVNYRWMVQYVRLNATLRGHGAVVNSYTPVLSNYMVKIRTGM